MEIKTIVTRLDSAEKFDEEVNKALNDGWTLMKREVLQQGQPKTNDVYYSSMLYAELAKSEEPAYLLTDIKGNVIRRI